MKERISKTSIGDYRGCVVSWLNPRRTLGGIFGKDGSVHLQTALSNLPVHRIFSREIILKRWFKRTHEELCFTLARAQQRRQVIVIFQPKCGHVIMDLCERRTDLYVKSSKPFDCTAHDTCRMCAMVVVVDNQAPEHVFPIDWCRAFTRSHLAADGFRGQIIPVDDRGEVGESIMERIVCRLNARIVLVQVAKHSIDTVVQIFSYQTANVWGRQARQGIPARTNSAVVVLMCQSRNAQVNFTVVVLEDHARSCA